MTNDLVYFKNFISWDKKEGKETLIRFKASLRIGKTIKWLKKGNLLLVNININT